MLKFRLHLIALDNQKKLLCKDLINLDKEIK